MLKTNRKRSYRIIFAYVCALLCAVTMVLPSFAADPAASEARNVAQNVIDDYEIGDFVIVTASDTHVDSENSVATLDSVAMAAAGIAALRQHIPIDSFAMLGDYTAAYGEYTAEKAISDIEYVKNAFAASLDGLSGAWVYGNHDINYSAERDRTLTEDELKQYIGDPYAFIDYPDKAVRVIYLNTADGFSEFPPVEGEKAVCEYVSAKQLTWLASEALDFTDKESPSEWSVILCSHHPVNYGGENKIGRVLRILEAYKNGETGSIEYTSDVSHVVAYDFANVERAEIVCNIHGHTHNYVSGYMGYTDDPWLLRVATPNVCVGRENECATNEDLSTLGEFDEDGEPLYWAKTVGTEDGTSFAVNVIDLDSNNVRSYAFGAGTERVLSYNSATLANDSQSMFEICEAFTRFFLDGADDAVIDWFACCLAVLFAAGVVSLICAPVMYVVTLGKKKK